MQGQFFPFLGKILMINPSGCLLKCSGLQCANAIPAKVTAYPSLLAHKPSLTALVYCEGRRISISVPLFFKKVQQNQYYEIRIRYINFNIYS